MYTSTRFIIIGILASLLVCGRTQAAEEDFSRPIGPRRSVACLEDLPRLRQKEHIRVLITLNRTNFFLADGKIRGFEYALLKEYEQHLNDEIGPGEIGTPLAFIPVSRDFLLPGLAEGYGDIAAAGLTITKARQKLVDFTEPYLKGINEILVTSKKTKAPENIGALAGKRVYVRKSSSYYESLQALNRRLRQQRKPPVKIVPVDENLETEDILELVNTGALERTVADSHIAEVWHKVLGGIRVHENIRLRENSRIAWAVRKNNPKLKQSLNHFIRQHRQGTLLGNIFFRRYYEKKQWIENPLEGDGNAKIERFRPLLEKYAHKYRFDWRLILAVAFQESRLNPKKKSPKGAVGLMQVLPSSAADPNVGIQNVHKLENNVHAAVKYLNFIRRHYFSDPNICPLDRVRFSLAAYNAGPARVIQAREQASRMNLDPNRWFQNVELAVLHTVGREPVDYVSNINKFFVIYSNALDGERFSNKIIISKSRSFD